MAYATAAELAAYVGAGVDLPAEPEQERLLERASELIDVVTLQRIDATDTDHTDAARDAATAQVEWWLSAGEDGDTSREVQSYSVGSLRISYGEGAAQQRMALAPRAKRHLWLAGLLDRRVGIA